MKKRFLLIVSFIFCILLYGCGEATQQGNTPTSTPTPTPNDPSDFSFITAFEQVTITGYCGASEKVVIPKTIAGKKVTGIGDQAFLECSKLTSINIPDSVISIGVSAFRECSSLTSIIIPNSVTSIGVCAFSGCSSLRSISIPEGVTSIGGGAFSGCSSLTSISIPEGVTSIGDMTFNRCYSLTSISIPASVMSIGKYVFENCSLSSVRVKASSYAEKWAKENGYKSKIVYY